ncbi:helix-turn-helix domain-containing protein [Actinokineospora sp. PR83]|uniref:helix-turn-helix domain-containing protein n=1 Tax=Actinokineospora sp. PR83 TaxID=2884908 RepID=UPI001F41C0D7|nr:helix-turn-helix transcriptional regulator [Actinokineospora sp. PR83]MCG8919429.1 helix-turn-helix domain-containing protein [Actinokineospora sp. PR83]
MSDDFTELMAQIKALQAQAEALLPQHELEPQNHGAKLVELCERYPAMRAKLATIVEGLTAAAEGETGTGARVVVIDSGSGAAFAPSTALIAARAADTPAEFGAALRELLTATGTTSGAVVRHDGGRELSRSTVSRMVNGVGMCRRPEQITAFVRACGQDREAPAWVGAWRDLRNRLRDHPGTATPAAAEGGTALARRPATTLVLHPSRVNRTAEPMTDADGWATVGTARSVNGKIIGPAGSTGSVEIEPTEKDELAATALFMVAQALNIMSAGRKVTTQPEMAHAQMVASMAGSFAMDPIVATMGKGIARTRHAWKAWRAEMAANSQTTGQQPSREQLVSARETA